MNFNDDDSVLYLDDSSLEPSRFSNFQPFFPNPIPGFPGGPNQGSNLNVGPPPDFTPPKNSPGVKSLSNGGKEKGPQTKAVSPGSISFCLFKFTYIWERGGRNYWAFLLNVDKKSVSGLRWFRGTWVYFGVDLNRIDSFVCYRSDYNEIQNTRKESLIQNKKEYRTDEVKDIYTKVLTSLEVPEEKDDFIISHLGEVEENDLTVRMPCKQRRIISYRIVLEIKYPESFNKSSIEEINDIAIEVSNDAIKYLDEFRDSKKFLTPFEIFNNSTKNIGKTVKVFSEEFYAKLKKLKLPRDTTKQIEFSITQEEIREPWRIV
ncbi:hypothetical protein R0131_14015 [Clostridium sp. AL.422]|uniref:hypothetical protein n=1 Tax=Clostridium TaxID=1485 RepID=UPI00293DD250|nr:MULTISPECIES: hypothetical protein [unclassified Clostridium]MDV4151939.1 hypothetical protein [Clostridium sp. AL.422]